MSSILKALKKVEVQSSGSESFFTMPEPIETNRENDSKARRRWFIRRLIAVFLILLVIFIAAVILLSQRRLITNKKIPTGVSGMVKKDSDSFSVSSKIFRAKIPSVPISQPLRPLKETRLAKKQVKSTAPASDEKEISANELSLSPKAVVDQSNLKPPSTARNPQPETAATPKKPLQNKPAIDATETSKKSVTAKSVPSGKPATQTKKPEKAETYDRIDDSKLKLQALAWFNAPPKRMAVINSRIVREGESVDGYQVTEIRRQDVVVSDGKKSWSLEFGLKQ